MAQLSKEQLLENEIDEFIEINGNEFVLTKINEIIKEKFKWSNNDTFIYLIYYLHNIHYNSDISLKEYSPIGCPEYIIRIFAALIMYPDKFIPYMNKIGFNKNVNDIINNVMKTIYEQDPSEGFPFYNPNISQIIKYEIDELESKKLAVARLRASFARSFMTNPEWNYHKPIPKIPHDLGEDISSNISLVDLPSKIVDRQHEEAITDKYNLYLAKNKKPDWQRPVYGIHRTGGGRSKKNLKKSKKNRPTS